MDRSNNSGRKKQVSGESKGIQKRGQGLGTGGPVGDKNGYKDRKSSSASRASGGSTQRRLTLPGIIIALIVVLFGGGGILSGNLSGQEGNTVNEQAGSNTGTEQSNGNSSNSDNSFGNVNGMLNSLFGSSTTGWADGSISGNTGVLNTEVANNAREKRTVIQGEGNDTITIMVYMCGTDLESKSGMATSDLTEMTKAQISDKINLLVYTGGCASWRNQVVSSSTNQIYQVKNGGLTCLVDNLGEAAMTNPDTLTGYIQWCAEHYPADRYELIFWDHGGGSISGYGYDEKFARSGSMNLAGINQSLKNAGVSFDFIGFDACLMATMETALMLSQYGDYMIASEETEPGIGWYYTDWLTALSQNTSMSTVELGKQIADDFVNTCIKNGQGQTATLSVVDLAELEKTAPSVLSAFSKSTSDLIQNENYQVVSNARTQTREFASSSKIDQVDLIHFAQNLGTEEGKQLEQVLRSAIKYNMTSKSMANSYGISIYFPYKRTSYVDTMVSTYNQIGMDKEYSSCIKNFASLEVSGQVATGGSSSPLSVLMGNMDIGSLLSSEMVNELLGAFLSSSSGKVLELDESNTSFLRDSSLDNIAEYVANNQFDASQLVWTTDEQGQQKLILSDEQWNLIQNLELNLFYDDGEGYIDLGLDNVYQFDEEGNLLADKDSTWLAINGQPVAYYFMDETRNGDEYIIKGYVPAMLNGEQVKLMLVFDEENPNGYIAGAQTAYDEEVTLTVAKGLTELQVGDKLDFLCDYYSYDGEFLDNYYLGEPMIVEENMVISNVSVEGEVKATYRLTDLYNQHYWTEPIE